jgi:hypothetical protein
MAEQIFERDLSHMFAEAPPLPDADLFALRVDERLRRWWTLRRTLIGGLGAVGGVVGGAQILGGGLVERLGAVTAQSGKLFTGKVIDLVQDNILPQSFPLDANMIWMASTLAAVAVIFAVTRVMREF